MMYTSWAPKSTGDAPVGLISTVIRSVPGGKSVIYTEVLYVVIDYVNWIEIPPGIVTPVLSKGPSVVPEVSAVGMLQSG